MRPKLYLKDKSQMSKPNEYTDIFKSNSICIFPSVRAKLKKTLCPRTLCTMEFTFEGDSVIRCNGYGETFLYAVTILYAKIEISKGTFKCKLCTNLFYNYLKEHYIFA